MSNIRILLLCGNRFALQTMQELAFFNQLAAVVIPSHCDEWREHAASALQGTDIPIIIVDNANYEEQLKRAFAMHDATMGLMLGFSFRIPEAVFNIPELGFFNVHPSPLPAYRGPDPVFYQIRNRETRTGITIHTVETNWDSGKIVMRELTPIYPTDTYGLLSYRLSILASKLVNNLVKLIGFGPPLPLKAQDESKASYQKKQTAREVGIVWERMEADEIIALINACNPWNKGASTRLDQRIVRFIEAVVVKGTSPSGAGTILEFAEHQLMVSCSNHQIIAISIVATDEGITNAGRLRELGAMAGQQFTSI